MKCEFEKKEITFFGHLFTEKGLKPDPYKVRVVLNCISTQKNVWTPKEKIEFRVYGRISGQRELCDNQRAIGETDTTKSEIQVGWRREHCIP